MVHQNFVKTFAHFDAVVISQQPIESIISLILLSIINAKVEINRFAMCGFSAIDSINSFRCEGDYNPV